MRVAAASEHPEREEQESASELLLDTIERETHDKVQRPVRALLVGVAVMGALALASSKDFRRPAALRLRGDTQGIEIKALCGLPLTDTNLLTKRTLDWLHDFGTLDQCRTRCEARDDCQLWVWSTARQICVLKALEPFEVPTREHIEGAISGAPCRDDSGRLVAPVPPTQETTSQPWNHAGIVMSGHHSSTVTQAPQTHPSYLAGFQDDTRDERPSALTFSGVSSSIAQKAFHEATRSAGPPSTPSAGASTTRGYTRHTESAASADAEVPRTASGGTAGSTLAPWEPAEVEGSGEEEELVWEPGPLAGDTGPLLFCFTLMREDTNEQALLWMQADEGWGVFSCTKPVVYSPKVVNLGSQANIFKTTVVDSDLKCDMGGKWNNALNTQIFLKVWEKVFESHYAVIFDWTIKVDPDSVFLPIRLRRTLSSIEDRPEGVYLNNCEFGLHGPLEVFSRNAVKMMRGGLKMCYDQLSLKCQGDCQYGEDMFLDKCLDQHLYVTRRNEFGILSEENCGGGGYDCSVPGIAAFHPFKKPKAYRTCTLSAIEALKLEPQIGRSNSATR